MRILLLSLLAGMFLLPVYAQKKFIRLQTSEINVDSIKHYHRILIVSEGGMQAYNYMNNLSVELIKGLKELNIECRYHYLGDPLRVNTDDSLKQARSWEHDAVLRFLPLANNERTRQHDLSYFTTPAGSNRSVYRQRPIVTEYIMENSFELSLEENNKNIWTARLESLSHPDKLTMYEKVRAVILKEMRRFYLIPRE
ncbi:hypothetical protein [Chitinophaga sp. CF418]|uniref:hypothetical protein n=1 Tax=Chitinophaga sp. CF418 TaxID=1855287 RepID=UPI00091B781B|nr:hypothetical protein [Chitinophaga sp. CF418]SHN41881.1 hypothetical protein SAMN05216311_11416 [Chitinophaga sp. CF418]